MRVRATKLGVGAHGGRILPGQEFEHEGKLGTWMAPVEGQAPSPASTEPPVQEQIVSGVVAEATETKARKPRKGAE